MKFLKNYVINVQGYCII